MGAIDLVKTADMKPYDEYLYLYPPRPENAITPDRIAYYEKQGWVGQYKKNGTNSVVALSPDGKFTAMNRHKEEHRAWQLTDHVKEVLIELLPRNSWTVLVGEILHNKTPTIKDTMYFHDVLVLNSTYLLGSTFEHRQQWLAEILPSNVESYSHYVVTEKVWRARTFTSGLSERFKAIKDTKIDEGLVLKKPQSTLKYCDIEKNNTSWQIKCRYPTKIYNY